MLNRLLILLLGSILFITCQQPEDASPEGRDSFVKFYGFTTTDVGAYAEPTDDGGFIILGNAEQDSLSTMYVIKTDDQGNITWKTRVDSTHGRSLKPLPGNSGYLVVGERMYEKNDQLNFRMLLAKINAENDFDTATYAIPGLRNFYGITLTLDGDSACVLVQEGNNPNTKNTILTKINTDDFNAGWFQRYDLADRGIEVGKSMHINASGNAVWSVSNTRSFQNKIDSYLSIPAVKQNSEAVSNDRYPDVDDPDTYFFASDIQPSLSGYCIIGSQTNVLNEDGKILFLQTTPTGIINQSSVKSYAKGSNALGNSIYPTNDGGYIILGTITSTADVGNGGQDFYLIKTDFQGNIIWDRLIGGSGNESGSTIRPTADGGYMIFGTTEINGSRFMCLVKTDSNGEL
jgi:hypothetical protein